MDLWVLVVLIVLGQARLAATPGCILLVKAEYQLWLTVSIMAGQEHMKLSQIDWTTFITGSLTQTQSSLRQHNMTTSKTSSILLPIM